MHTFRVWAPAAARVSVVLGEGPIEMARAEGGWWAVAVGHVGPGTQYRFSVDGGPPRPDPRSSYQPDGIGGPSEVVEPAVFPWSDGAWRGVPLESAVIYELHIGTFTGVGTFDAAIEKLPHLVALGVDVIELLPVNQFSGDRGWGYDGVGLFAPHAAYGGPDGLRRLVDAAHVSGLGVVMDVVYNHLGPAGNFLGEFGPYFTSRYSTPWGEAVNFDDADSDEVRRFFLDNACMWLRDYHCDGLRLDAVHAIVDTSATHILEELSVEVERLATGLGRRLFLIAESDLNDPRVVARREVGGYGMDAQWSDDLHHCLHTVLTGERSGYYADFGSLAQLAKALQQAFVYDGGYAPERRRRHGRPPVGIPTSRFLGYLQTHDQVGNRATGERSSHLLATDLLQIGAALVLTSPFVPMIFQGEEWGASTPFQYFTDHRDPDLGRAVSEGRRREFASFGWKPEDVPDPQDPATFERSKLDWSEVARTPHAELFEWHRQLIGLRRDWPELAPGPMDATDVRYDEDAHWIMVRRGRVTTAVNLAEEPVSVPLANAGAADLLLWSRPGGRIDGDNLIIPARGVIITV